MISDPAPAILTRGLRKSFGGLAAVDGADLEVARGCLHGLIGPDGAGKTTLIRLLAGLLRPSGGTATVLGHDLETEPARIQRRIGYLSQQFTLYGDLTTDENIEFFAEIHSLRDFRKRRDELLEFTRLTPFRGRLAEHLSGGMKKKLALACTLIHAPDLLLLDEPTTGVDPVSRGEFWNILATLLDEGVTILMSTPYLDEADRGDRVSLIHRGRIIAAGRPDEIKSGMAGEVREIVCASAPDGYRLLRGRWPPSRIVLAGDRLRLRIDGGEGEVADACARLTEAGLGPVRVERAGPSLEDAFVALTEPKEDQKR